MLKIKLPAYKFCPFCGRKLKLKDDEGKKRKFCKSCGWTYYPHVSCAVAAVIVKDTKMLMVKRAREPYKNTWMFPAGFVDYGEHPLETLAREVKEETGLKVKEAILMEIVQTKDDPRAPGHFCFFYKVNVSGGRIKTNKEENKEIAWFSLKRPPKIGWQAHKYIYKKFLKSP